MTAPPVPPVPRNLPAPAGGNIEHEHVPERWTGRVRSVLRRHGHKLWWLHSVYALILGAFVVFFAQKGFGHARWLAVSLGVTWLLVVLFCRVFGKSTQAIADTAPTKVKVRFYVMTYVLKNLYQGMLFFLLPFYWKTATFGAENSWFVLLLGACAIVSTVDLVFDRILMRFRLLGSLFHGLTLFGCLNLVIPALFPNTRALISLLSAAGLTVIGFWTIHVPLALLRRALFLVLLVASEGAGIGTAYALRTAIPPVPMHLSAAAVGPSLLPDGRLAMEVTSLHASVLSQLIAVTDVVVPGGKGDRLVHVWRQAGVPRYRAPENMSRVRGPFGTVRLRSMVGERDLPADAVGPWSVDVETDDGQLVGRITFRVVE